MDTSARLNAGDTAPDFALPDQNGDTVSLAALRGQKVIVFFYPEADTPACTTEACDFRDSVAGLQAAGYAVVGISRDSVAKLKSWHDSEGFGYPLLSDPELVAHHAYAVWGQKNMYGKLVTGVLRSTFVIDQAGSLTLAQYNVRATGHVAALKKKLRLA
ncbi:peroxiredoxin [Microbacteriaceae bacterium VKM Ac-2855]|nr:peroxiredoxin [Microbacteriaceae bacterium VKM Ac-2855]